MLHAAVVSLAYLLGSIPFGYLLVRLFVGGDVRETGSGGTGATNVTRRAGKGVGVLTLLLDLLKGAAAVLAAEALTGAGEGAQWWVCAAGAAAVVGHVFPVWLGFRGGGGAAARRRLVSERARRRRPRAAPAARALDGGRGAHRLHAPRQRRKAPPRRGEQV